METRSCPHVNTPPFPVPPISLVRADVYKERMIDLKKKLANRDERTLLVVTHGSIIHELTCMEVQPGQLGTARMELFCSRCRCGMCWAPAMW